MDSYPAYIRIVKQNLQQWSSIADDQIVFTKLQGLSNEIHKVSFNDLKGCYQNVKPKNVVLRIFGDLGGLVDPVKEHRIFVELGNAGIGPKCLAYGGKWRIEQFIEQGQHPNINNITVTQKRLVAKYLAELHKGLQNIKIDKSKPMIYQIINSEKAMKNYQEKCARKNLYSEQELKQIKEISTVINTEEQQFLNSILPNIENSFLCHNDVHLYNMFFCDVPKKQVIFIDYEYCNFNYKAYDLANFMNEVTYNYAYDKNPYYDYVAKNFFQQDQIIDFIKYYLASFYLVTQQQAYQLEQIILQEKDEIDSFISSLKISDFQQKLKQMFEDVLKCRLLAHWYWIQWSVLTAKPEIKINFDHLSYGIHRLHIYQQLKKELLKRLESYEDQISA